MSNTLPSTGNEFPYLEQPNAGDLPTEAQANSKASFGSVKEFGGYLAGNKDMEDRGRVQKEAGRAEYHNPNEIVPSGEQLIQ
ncbi:hypothetical protein BT69DRAFT_290594 [Atractiella rhizophila]|nr:hypothetical protein BT69DRAFT_290594 [Atractiella rhizophila]